MADSLEEIAAELQELKKKLYTFQLKGIELHKKARVHFKSHLQDAAAEASSSHGDGGAGTEIERNDDPKISGFGPNPAANPLSNEYILEMIVFHLPYKDLQSCKKVCRLWEKEITRWELKKKSLVIASDSDIEEVQELVKQKRAGNFIAVSNLVIVSAGIDSDPVRSVAANFGNTLSSLHVDDCSLMTAQEMYSLLTQLPCLDYFAVKANALRRNRINLTAASPLDQVTSANFSPPLVLSYLRELVWLDDRPVTCWSRLSRMCPSLENLKISAFAASSEDVGAFEDIQWNSLKSLDIRMCSTERQALCFGQLAAMNLKLSSLSAANVTIGGTPTVESVRKFLRGIRNTLTSMKLLANKHVAADKYNMRPFRSRVKSFLIGMPVLEVLHIDMPFVNTLQFMNDMPALKTFTCLGHNWISWWCILNSSSLAVHHNLQKLTLGAIDNESLVKLAEGFSCITRLELREDCLDDKMFRTVCSRFQNLKSFRAFPSTNRSNSMPSLTDSGLTGFSTENCERLTTSCEVIPDRDFPCLKDLKDLELLELANTQNLTDVSVKFGIFESSSLLYASLSGSKITNDAFKDQPTFFVSKDKNGLRIRRRNSPFKHGTFSIPNFANYLDNAISKFSNICRRFT